MAEFLRYSSAYTTGRSKDLFDAYRELPGSLAKKHIQAAMRRAIKPFAPALRRGTPRGPTGNLRRSVKVIVRFYNRANVSGSVVGVVGFSKGAKKNQMGHHSAIVEGGTGERFTRGGIYRGQSPARHMVRETLRAHRDGIRANLELQLGASLEKAAAELAIGKLKGRFRGF